MARDQIAAKFKRNMAGAHCQAMLRAQATAHSPWFILLTPQHVHADQLVAAPSNVTTRPALMRKKKAMSKKNGQAIVKKHRQGNSVIWLEGGVHYIGGKR